MCVRAIAMSEIRRLLCLSQGETSFEFLGFEFRWGVNRKGQAWLKRRTTRKKLSNSLKRVTEWCRQNRHRHVREQVQLLNAKLRGYNNYYGVSGNYASLDEFFYHATSMMPL